MGVSNTKHTSFTNQPDGAVNMSQDEQASTPSEYFESYRHYAQVLRAWLVGYGVGVPVLLISQSDIVKPIIASGFTVWIFGLFLLGVAAQVVIALLYKYSMAILYENEYSESEIDGKRLSFAYYMGTRYWPDIVGDATAVISYITATALMAYAVFGQVVTT